MGVAKSHNLEQDPRHRQSICEQTPLRFNLTLGETFSKSTSITRMKKMTKALSWRFHKYLRRFHMLTVKAWIETALFREWCEQDFQSLISEIH